MGEGGGDMETTCFKARRQQRLSDEQRQAQHISRGLWAKQSIHCAARALQSDMPDDARSPDPKVVEELQVQHPEAEPAVLL